MLPFWMNKPQFWAITPTLYHKIRFSHYLKILTYPKSVAYYLKIWFLFSNLDSFWLLIIFEIIVYYLKIVSCVTFSWNSDFSTLWIISKLHLIISKLKSFLVAHYLEIQTSYLKIVIYYLKIVAHYSILKFSLISKV